MNNTAKLSLVEKLNSLYLSNTAVCYEQYAKQAAKHNLSYEIYLEQLVDEELSIKQKRLIERKIREAKFPSISTLDQYDFTHPKHINKQLVLKLFDLRFIPEKEWVVFVGNSGLGKTHLAKALGYAACQQRHKVLFTKTAHVINTLQAAQSDHSFDRALKCFTKPDLLILDETGFLPLDQSQANLLFQVITDRYEFSQGATIITTNLAFKDWGRIFQDSVLAQAAVDRIIHRCQMVKIEGDSYRCKGK